MRDEAKTKKQLLNELKEIRRQLVEFETSSNKQTEPVQLQRSQQILSTFPR